MAFDIDADGILNVSAKDKHTGKAQSIVIRSSGGLSDKEIEAMVRDAEANAAADEKRKALVDVSPQLSWPLIVFFSPKHMRTIRRHVTAGPQRRGVARFQHREEPLGTRG